VFAVLAIAVLPALPAAIGQVEEAPPAEIPALPQTPPAEPPAPADPGPPPAQPEEPPAEPAEPAETPPEPPAEPVVEPPPEPVADPPAEPVAEPVVEPPPEPQPIRGGLQSFGAEEVVGIPDPPPPTVEEVVTEVLDGPVDATTEIVARPAPDLARPLESQSRPRAVLGNPVFATLTPRERAAAKARAHREIQQRLASTRPAARAARVRVADTWVPAPPPQAAASPAPEAGTTSAEPGDVGAATAPRRASRKDDSAIPIVPIVIDALSESVAFVPLGVWAVLGALILLALLTLAFAVVRDRHARRLVRERATLMADIETLEGAVVPALPEALGGLALSVTNTPATGPAAGGDFHDAFPLSRDRVAVIIGDVAGQGRQVLADAQLVRHAVRAYLEAGLDPRSAIAMTGSVVDEREDRLFATVLVAVHDRRDGTLTFASAGHEPPVLVIEHGAGLPPVPGWSPPLGTGLETGRRQTQMPLPEGSAVCLVTDGVTEARSQGERTGISRLIRWLSALGPGAMSSDVAARLAEEADATEDDVTVCMLRALTPAAPNAPRIEEAVVEGGDPTYLVRFLRDCGLPLADAEEAGEALAAQPDGTRMIASVEIRGGRAVVELAPLRGSATEMLIG
jgi:hypothetical protein